MNSMERGSRGTFPLPLYALVVLASVLGLASPVAAQDEDSHGHPEKGEEHAEAVHLDDATCEEFGIRIVEATPAEILVTREFPGEIQPNGDRLGHIVPRYPGIVTEVRARIGDRVQEGQVLAMIESDESLAPYPLRTLLEGIVLDRHLSLGEAVGRDHLAFVVADLDTVWADLTIYQRDLSTIEVGQPVTLWQDGDGGPVVTSLQYISP